MIFATVNGEKIQAKPKTIGICPLCEQTVFSKCGEIIVWHWAHKKDEGCDSWYEPETQWHKNWKLIFGRDNCEIVIKKEGIRHIADIRTKQDVIIELQNSPILRPIIRKRETFYGERMIWIINGKNFKDNFDIHPYIFSDREYYRFNNPLSPEFRSVEMNSLQKQLSFRWDRPRKSWAKVQRNVFIDFGDDQLFWVRGGMGTSFGKGVQISKEQFVRKYEGDLDLLATVIDTKKV